MFRCRNYLRVRGEYRTAQPFCAFWELPPRARRIRGVVGWWSWSGGTTSACAENTAGRSSNPGQTWNYLRVRGEYTMVPRTLTPMPELPPRARRILDLGFCVFFLCGTTSACAENTGRLPTLMVHRWNYLRVRGEYSGNLSVCKHFQELPPRARRILREP